MSGQESGPRGGGAISAGISKSEGRMVLMMLGSSSAESLPSNLIL